MFARKDAIKDSSSIRDVLKLIEFNSWLILDLDNTVVEPIYELGSDQWFVELNKHAQQLMQDKQDEASSLSIALYHEVQRHLKMRAVEFNVIKIIKHVQAIGIPVIALTARDAILKNVTLRQLKEVNIQFDEIIFCNGKNKGECLKSYLSQQNDIPSHLVMVDDKKQHLDHVMKALQKMEIQFSGIRYGFLDEKVNRFDFNSTHLQLEKIKHRLPDSTKAIIAKFQIANDKGSSQILLNSDFFIDDNDEANFSVQREIETDFVEKMMNEDHTSNECEISQKPHFKL